MNVFHTPERRGSEVRGDEDAMPSTSRPERQRRLTFAACAGEEGDQGNGCCEGATCAICLSPLRRKTKAGEDEESEEEYKGGTYVLPCSHEFHQHDQWGDGF